MKPNVAQLLSLLRTLLQIAGTAIVAHGTLGINGAMWEQLSGGIIMIAPVIWSMFVHTDDQALKTVEVRKVNSNNVDNNNLVSFEVVAEMGMKVMPISRAKA
mgnify:CR=1 FL=1